MEVRKIENPAGNLVRIEFTRINESDFKTAIVEWLHENYPDWDYKDLYERILTLGAGTCIIGLEQG